MVSGGLQLRCARSVYYANLFKDKLQDLGVVPLEHYQSYDAFMRRYVYQLWDRVSIVGSTYTSCVAKLSEMMDRIESQRTQIRSENLTIIGTVGGVLVISRELMINAVKSLEDVYGRDIVNEFIFVDSLFLIVIGILLYDITLNGRKMLASALSRAIELKEAILDP